MPANRAINPLERGRRVALFLKGSWRFRPPALALQAEVVNDLVPHLISTGAGGLAWWKVSDGGRRTDHLGTSGAGLLERTYHDQRRDAFIYEIHLQEAIATLRRGGIEPLLSKGWTVARLYPMPGLRPNGDIDLHVDPSRLEDAVRVLSADPYACLWVDLHQGVPEMPERPIADLRRRTRQVVLGDCLLQTLGPEDQLRHLCLHFARHGGWRPLWLCDIGAFLDALPAGFDWDYCLSGDARLSAWVRFVLGLAVRLLDAAETHQAPHATAEAWLDATVLREWGTFNPGDSHSRDRTPMTSYIFRPWLAWKGVSRRLPNPIEAAFKAGAYPQAARNLVWHRLCYGWSRTTRFVRRLMSPSRSAVEVHVNE